MTLFCLVGHYFACDFLKSPLSNLKDCVHSINNVLRFVPCETGIIINADILWLSLVQNCIDCLYLLFYRFSLCNLLCGLLGRISQPPFCSWLELFVFPAVLICQRTVIYRLVISL